MKTLRIWIVTTMVLLTIVSTQTNAATEPSRTDREQTRAESAEARSIIARINEINVMDKSKLTGTEKKELRKEVRNSKKQLRQSGGGGVYLSVGVLLVIIIVILLVILL